MPDASPTSSTPANTTLPLRMWGPPNVKNGTAAPGIVVDVSTTLVICPLLQVKMPSADGSAPYIWNATSPPSIVGVKRTSPKLVSAPGKGIVSSTTLTSCPSMRAKTPCHSPLNSLNSTANAAFAPDSDGADNVYDVRPAAPGSGVAVSTSFVHSAAIPFVLPPAHVSAATAHRIRRIPSRLIVVSDFEVRFLDPPTPCSIAPKTWKAQSKAASRKDQDISRRSLDRQELYRIGDDVSVGSGVGDDHHRRLIRLELKHANRMPRPLDRRDVALVYLHRRLAPGVAHDDRNVRRPV